MYARVRYRPVGFFLLTFALSWGPWFGAAWCSHQAGLETGTLLLSFLGLLGPFTSALVHLRTQKDAALWRDFKDRLVNLRRLNSRYLPATLLMMPVATALAIWLSLTWGALATQWTFIPNLFAMLPLMFLAPFFEELGWRGYGVDALRARVGMGAATAAFAALWTVWHAPLFLIDHTYQHDLLQLGPLYVVNFLVSVVPAAVVSNWLYYKHRRSIAAAVLFHFMLDAVAEGFRIEQPTKCVVTVVFLVVAVLILAFDRRAFAQPSRDFIAEGDVA